MPKDPLDLMSVFPTPRWPGEKLRLFNGDAAMVIGTVLQRRLGPNGSQSFADEVLFSDSQSIDVDNIDACHTILSAPDATYPSRYPVSADLHRVLQTIIEEPGHGLAWQMMRDAHELLGYQMYVVGGAIRDLISGQATSSESINDLDITGDMPPGLFSDLAKISSFRKSGKSATSKRAQRQQVTDVWIPYVTVSASGVVHCYRLDSGADRSQPPKEDHFLEYAPLKHSRRPFNNLGQRDEFVFGRDLREDRTWRDMTINCLLYDPFEGEILDPGDDLADSYGLTSEDLLNWHSASVKQRKVRLKPLPLPTDPTLFWTAKAVARLIKSADKYKDANLTDAVAWLARGENEIRKVPACGESPASESLEQNLRAQFHIGASTPGFGDKASAIHEAVERLHSAGAPDWFYSLVLDAISSKAEPSRVLGAGKGIWPKDGTNAYRLEQVSVRGTRPVYRLGSPLPQPREGGRDAYEFWAWNTAGYAIESALISEGGPDLLPTYVFRHGDERVVPVDGTARIVSFNVEGDLLSHLHDGDLSKLAELFPRDGRGQIQPHHLGPDNEAPSDEDWPPDWPKPSVRSKPNPREKELPEKEKTDEMLTLEVLQRMRNAGLVQVCEPDKDLFWACMNSGLVELTPLGRYYRSQVAEPTLPTPEEMIAS